MTGIGRKGMALFLVFLLVLQTLSRAESVQAAAEGDEKKMQSFRFLVTESREETGVGSEIAVAGAKVKIVFSERIFDESGNIVISPEDGSSIVTSGDGSSFISPEDGSNIPLIPGTELGTGVTDGQGRVAVQIPKCVPAAYCDYTVEREGYHSLVCVPMENVEPETVVKAAIDWIPMFQKTKDLKISWTKKYFDNVLTDSRGNALAGAKYSVKELIDGDNTAIAGAWLGKYVSVDENTGQVTVQDMAKLPEVWSKLPMKLTVQGKKTGLVSQQEDIAEYTVLIVKAADEVKWKDVFAGNELIYGTTGARLTAVSAGNVKVKYKVDQGAEFISIDENSGEITYRKLPRPQEGDTGRVKIKAYTEKNNLYEIAETSYTFTLKNLLFDVDKVSLQGFHNDADGVLQPALTTYGDYQKDRKWFAGDRLALVYEGYQFSSSVTDGAQWEDAYDLTKVTPDDGALRAEFYVKETATGRISDKLTVEGILWDNVAPWNLQIRYSAPLWQQELEKGFLNYYGKNEKLSVTLSAQEDASKIAGFAWGYTSREGKENSESYTVVEATAANQVKVENGVTSVTFEIDREDCMNVDFYAYDNAGNRSETYKDEQTAVLLDRTAPLIFISYDNNVSNGDDTYYNRARTATITIEEEHFTAKQEVQEESAKGWVKAEMTASGDAQEEPSVQIGGQSVPISGVGAALQNHGNWQVVRTNGKTYHTVQIIYTADAKYEFHIQAEDTAGNRSESKGDAFWVDKTSPLQPEITYSEEKNKKEISGVLRKYYNSDVTVNVALQDKLSGVKYMEWRENSSASWKKGTRFEQQNGKMVARLALKGEGGRTMAVRAYDKAGNCTEYTDNKTQIIVDSTKPELTVAFDEAQAQNGKYYSEPRTAGISIKETNFDASRLSIKVRAEDVAGKTISGNTEILLNGMPVKVQNLPAELRKDEAWTYEKGAYRTEIVFMEDAGYQFDIRVQDLALLSSREAKNTFYIDQKNPKNLQIIYSEPILEKILSKITFGYYKSHVTAKFSAEDVTSGVDSLHWSYTKEGGASEQNVKELRGDVSAKDLTFSKDGSQASYKLKLPAQKAHQYRGNLTFFVTDKAGNRKTFRDQENQIVVDNISPTMKVSYTPIKSTRNKAYFADDAVLYFEVTEANFYKQDVEVTVNGEEHAIGNWKQEKGTDVWKATLTLREDGDYKVKVVYQDRSGNEMKAQTDGNKQTTVKTWISNTLVVDTKKPIIKVWYDNTTPISSRDGNDYYDRERTATIQITDKNFRANEVEASVTVVMADGAPASVADYREQLKQPGSWKKNGDTYTAKITYDVDANYTFTVSYADMAKNVAKPYVQDRFTIDTAAPANLRVSYSDSVLETVLENASFGFYQARATVTITAEDDAAGIDYFIYSYKNAENVSSVNRESLDQRIEHAQISYSNGKRMATAQFTIPQSELDANNQFNGMVEFDAVDNSGHKTRFTDTHRIVVDSIAPNAEVTYSAPTASANGIDYYAEAVEGQIAVTEANFREEDVQVTATRDGAPYILNVSWSDASTDVHNGSFQLSEDGDYQVSITYKDKSGNDMTPYESNQITVDGTAPVISIGEIADKTAYNKEVIGFTVDVDDVNFDLSSFQPKLTGIVYEKNGRFAQKDFSDLGRIETVESGKRYEYVIDNITEDAIYTLACEVKDLSLNATSEMNVKENGNQGMETITFSVNRNGSTFMLDKSTQELIDKYYVQQVDAAVVLQEVNCDPVTQHFVTVNGNTIKEDGQYRVQGGEGENAWYQYDYVIDREVFADEGDYNVVVSTIDKAENMAYSDIKNVETSFVVDHTPPVVIVSGLAPNGRYQEESQNVNVIPTDDGGKLDSLEITIANRGSNAKTQAVSLGRKQLADAQEKNDGVVQFTIPQGIGQEITILCRDAAGNVYEKIYKNITVSTEWYIMFLANRPLLFGISGTAATVVAVGTAGVVLRKRKRRRK